MQTEIFWEPLNKFQVCFNDIIEEDFQKHKIGNKYLFLFKNYRRSKITF